MIYVAQERLRVGMTRVLQSAFQTNTQFRWDSNTDITQITILKEWPKVLPKYPCVVVTTGPGEAPERTFGQELRQEVLTSVSVNGMTKQVTTGWEYGGGYNFNVTIKVISNDTVTRDRVLDWVGIYLRWFFWDKLMQNGIAIHEIRFDGDNQEYIGNDLVYATSMTFRTFTEWNHTVTVSEVMRLNAITITNLFVINYDGTTN